MYEMGLEDLPITEALLIEYEQMLVRLERGRDRAHRLQELAQQAAEQVEADERLIRALAEVLGKAPQGTIHELGGALRGERLRQVAVEVLMKHRRPGEDVHYREWYAMVSDEGFSIAGRDPLATFLAQVSRADTVEAVGKRSGLYHLRVA